MRLCLWEDGIEQLEPLSLTRPVFDLRCGLTTLGDKQRRHFGIKEWGALVRPPLEELFQLQHPHVPVNDADWLRTDTLVLVNGRWLPPDDGFTMPASSCIGMVGDTVAYVVLPSPSGRGAGGEGLVREAFQAHSISTQTRSAKPSTLTPSPSPGGRGETVLDRLNELLEEWQQTLPVQPAGGRMIAYPWDLVDQNANEITRDFGWLKPVKETWERPALVVAGPLGNLWIASSARIEPMVVADTTHGPVVIDEDAVITAFTRLEGPCYIGPKSQINGAKIRAGTSIGPQCRVGGEVEASILHGYSNKYHEGFLGHSYVGEWVNLGAGTHNSDLRNDYGEVTVTVAGVPVPTGMNKVGCFLGDHTKTGLGTLFNTGTSVGAFCNLLPAGRFAPKYVPSFTSWWNGSLREAFTLEQLLTTAEIAMNRRGVTLTDAHKTLYAWLTDETQEERRRAMRESEQRQLRKSA